MKRKSYIKICPAILEVDESAFREQLLEYSKIFEQIDIDVNESWDWFEGNITLNVQSVVGLIKECFKSHVKTRFNFHLMLDFPIPAVHYLSTELRGYDFSVLVHQESEISEIMSYKAILNNTIGVVVKAESALQDIKFYKQYREVQLMTVETGKQGGEFIPEVLKRVEWLRKAGYNGSIAIDGGVNLDTAKEISKHGVNHVSVGSYFSKSKDIKSDLQKLNNILNS